MGFKIPSGTDKVQFSIRVDEDDFEIIEKLSKKSRKSYNYVVNKMIKYAIENMELDDKKTKKKSKTVITILLFYHNFTNNFTTNVDFTFSRNVYFVILVFTFKTNRN